MASVELKNIDKLYGQNHVLKNISYSIPEGEFLVLLGPSGCGKSTLLNSIAGLEDIDGGEIWIQERDVTDLSPHQRNIAMVFQSYALYPTMTVRKNMEFALKMNKRLSKNEIKERVEKAAHILQITDYLDRKPAQLSGGQRQRVAIGRALVRDSKVFLFDEPLSNLDAKLRSEMRVEIKKLHRILNNTIIYVTHDQVEAMTMATQVVLLKEGEIQQSAPPKELYNKPANLFVASFIGSPVMNFINIRLKANGGTIDGEWGDISFPLSFYPFKETPQNGQEAIMGIRAENIKKHQEKSDAPSIRLPVELLETLGSDTMVWTRLEDGTKLSARLSADDVTEDQKDIQLDFHLEKISLFDPQTTERL